MNTYPTPNFVLSTIRNNRNIPPKGMYQIFYKAIQQKELETMKYMQIALDLIALKQKKINIDSDNSEDKARRQYAVQILSEVDADIRNVVSKNTSFLRDLQRVLTFQLDGPV